MRRADLLEQGASQALHRAGSRGDRALFQIPDSIAVIPARHLAGLVPLRKSCGQPGDSARVFSGNFPVSVPGILSLRFEGSPNCSPAPPTPSCARGSHSALRGQEPLRTIANDPGAFRGWWNGLLEQSPVPRGALAFNFDPRGGAVPDMRGESDRCTCGVALEGRLVQAYNEEAFRYFLAIERKRSERSGRPLLLLLVDLKEQPGVDVRIDPMVVPNLFSGLRLCLRETDFIGWYREERVVGAVLIELGEGSRTEVSRLVTQRVNGVLCEGLPSDVARRLQVRVCQDPEPGRIDSGGDFHSLFSPGGPVVVGLS